MAKYDIKDLSLWKEGRIKIDWVKKNMPLMNGFEKKYSKTKPFKGLRLSMCMHLEAKTGYLCEVLKNCGAEVFVCGSNTLSTKDDIASALVKLGINVFAHHNASEKLQHSHYVKVVENKPHLLIDDGADIAALLCSTHKKYAVNLIGGAEETTTGIQRLKAMDEEGILLFPMLASNDAKCKFMFDNRYGTGQSVMEAIMHNLNLIIASKTFVVIGYGWCSRGIAMRASAMGAKVIVTEIDSVKAMEAKMDGFDVMKMDDAAKFGDIFVSATGCNKTITVKHALKMKDGAVLANAGHFNVEIDMEDFKKKAKKIYKTRDNTDGYVLSNGKTINIMADGKLVNIAASYGHPAEIMDLSFAVQFNAIKYALDNKGKLPNKLLDISEKIDNMIAKQKLTAWGINIDKLTKEQEEYLKSWEL